MATLFRVNQTKQTIQLVGAAGGGDRLKQLQELVGGYVQHIYLSDGRHLLMDEEGKLKQRPYNPHATALASDVLLPFDVIVGDAVLLEPGELA